jgi:hypothetical protein
VNSDKTTESSRGGAAAPITFVYSIDHEVPDLLRVAEGLRGRGIVMLPSVGISYMMADANAWESPNEQVAVRGVRMSDVQHRTIMLPGEYASLGEYIDALARAVLGEPEQCLADGCLKSEEGFGYCSGHGFEAGEPEDDGEADDSVEAMFLENIRTTWTIRLTNGLLTGYPTWQRAVHVARSFNPPMIVRISGPEGTVPFVGESLKRALEGGDL